MHLKNIWLPIFLLQISVHECTNTSDMSGMQYVPNITGNLLSVGDNPHQLHDSYDYFSHIIYHIIICFQFNYTFDSTLVRCKLFHQFHDMYWNGCETTIHLKSSSIQITNNSIPGLFTAYHIQYMQFHYFI